MRIKWRRKRKEGPKHTPFTQCLMIGCTNHTGVLPSGKKLAP